MLYIEAGHQGTLTDAFKNLVSSREWSTFSALLDTFGLMLDIWDLWDLWDSWTIGQLDYGAVGL